MFGAGGGGTVQDCRPRQRNFPPLKLIVAKQSCVWGFYRSASRATTKGLPVGCPLARLPAHAPPCRAAIRP